MTYKTAGTEISIQPIRIICVVASPEALRHKACSGGAGQRKTPTENSWGLCIGGGGGS